MTIHAQVLGLLEHCTDTEKQAMLAGTLRTEMIGLKKIEEGKHVVHCTKDSCVTDEDISP